MSNIAYIKTHADVKAIMESLGTEPRDHGASYRTQFPIHGGTNPLAFDINATTGSWYCHTQCQKGGDIIALVQQVKDVNFYGACEFIAKVSGFSLDGVTFTKEEISEYEEAKRWFGAFEKPYKHNDYDISVQTTYPVEGYRGLKKETLEAYGVFFSKEYILTNSISHNRIGFPIIFNEQVIGVDLRATKITDSIKWLRQPKGLSIGHALYNYDNVQDDDYVVLVEGIMDALTLIQQGYPALCTFGASITKPQANLIRNLGVGVYIAYDGDTAGYKGVNQIYRELSQTCNLYNIKIPEGSDPGELEPEVFEGLFEGATMMRKEVMIK